jgi:hypothetical protein
MRENPSDVFVSIAESPSGKSQRTRILLLFIQYTKKSQNFPKNKKRIFFYIKFQKISKISFYVIKQLRQYCIFVIFRVKFQRLKKKRVNFQRLKE